jgi:hypothetical protein
VIHRGLVHEVGKIADAAGAPVPEEDHVIVADHGQGGVVGGNVHEQPVAAERPARQHRVDLVEARDVHQSGMHGGRVADAFVSLDHVPARHGHEELASASRERRGIFPRHLRVLDPERRGLAHLPANQLFEVLLLRWNFFEPDERNLGDRVGQDQGDPAGA